MHFPQALTKVLSAQATAVKMQKWINSMKPVSGFCFHSFKTKLLPLHEKKRGRFMRGAYLDIPVSQATPANPSGAQEYPLHPGT